MPSVESEQSTAQSIIHTLNFTQIMYIIVIPTNN